jgi:hypothetical protein
MVKKTASLLGVLFAVAVVALFIVPGCGSGASSVGGNGGNDASMGGDDAGRLTDAASGVEGGDANFVPPQGCSGYPGQDPSTLSGSGCCSAGPSHCVASSAIPPGIVNSFVPCNDGGGGDLCVPDSIIQKGSEYVPTTCMTKILTFDLQGVCLSKCITLVSGNPDVGVLKTETCGQGELCVPCMDPLTMQPTGACTISNLVCGGDAGTMPTPDAGGVTCPYTGPPLVDPTMFPQCSPTCSGAHCVPSALVPAADQAQLASCMSNGMPGFCAPDTFIASDGNSVPTTCTSIAGSEGRCLSTCLPAVAALSQLLPQDVCPAGEKCSPCFNPTAANPMAPTGACSLACDRPAKPPTILTCPWTGPPVLDPTTLPACDNGGCAGAHCLPAAEVPASVQSQLAACNSNTGFCAPDEIISTGDNFVPPTCDPFPGSGAPGRCLSDCLPSVQTKAAAGTIVPSSCSAGNYCVPCNDPFTGAATGACSLSCDTPPEQPFTFPKCCDDGSGTLTGTCVPSAQIPSSQQSSLDQGGNGNDVGCPASSANYLCVPNEYLPPPYNTTPLQFCPATFLNLCGTCVSQCVVNSTLGILGPSDCAANHKCAPCDVAPSTPGCSSFCSGSAVCGNSCGCDADCSGSCGICNGGDGTCGDGSGTCDSQ